MLNTATAIATLFLCSRLEYSAFTRPIPFHSSPHQRLSLVKANDFVSKRHPIRPSSFYKLHNNREPAHTVSSSEMNIATSSDAQPKTNKHSPTTNEPTIMNGRRRPHFDVDRSVIIPTRGCIINPDNGPAIHTSEVFDFVRPSWRRYGVQSAVSRGGLV